MRSPATGRIIDPFADRRSGPFPSNAKCEFCFVAVDEVVRLIAGPAELICDQCIDQAAKALVSKPASQRSTAKPCAFCSAVVARCQYGVDKVICDACVELCVEILREDDAHVFPSAIARARPATERRGSWFASLFRRRS